MRAPEPHVGGEGVVGGGDLARRGLVLGREGDRLARLEAQRLRPACRPGCAGPADRAARRPRPARSRVTSRSCVDPARADLGGAVRGVDADDVDAGVEQRGHLVGLSHAGPSVATILVRRTGVRGMAGSLMPGRHRCITTSPPTTVSTRATRRGRRRRRPARPPGRTPTPPGRRPARARACPSGARAAGRVRGRRRYRRARRRRSQSRSSGRQPPAGRAVASPALERRVEPSRGSSEATGTSLPNASVVPCRRSVRKA